MKPRSLLFLRFSVLPLTRADQLNFTAPFGPDYQGGRQFARSHSKPRYSGPGLLLD